MRRYFERRPLMALLLATLWVFGQGAMAGAASARDAGCLWSQLPTAAQARIELSIRRGEKRESATVSVINRLGRGGLTKLLKGCGYRDDHPSVMLAYTVWRAAAAYEIARIRMRLSSIPPGAVDKDLDRLAPPSQRVALAEEVMRREPIKAPFVIGAMLEARDQAVAAQKQRPLSDTQKRLMISYAAARIIYQGLRAGAKPPHKAPKR